MNRYLDGRKSVNMPNPVGASCGPLQTPKNGYLQVNENVVEGSAVYTCKPGFQLAGPKVRFCTGALRWSGPEPECHDLQNQCFMLPWEENVVFLDAKGNDVVPSMKRFPSGEKFLMKCREGFNDSDGKDKIEVSCTGNKWSYQQMNCRRVDCGKLAAIANGQIEYFPDTGYHSKAVQSCHRGYRALCATLNPANSLLEES
ncbi:hypothetical protein Ciccas_012135, partial [Cichlidogyrus casuarinus]